ncbi:class I SAM-dependent methyltransferase [Kitasatospora sp. MY 5-36]|uniref:class I SAM-dependent methyltransferase n=1 Tax=Kitasatospora sp. MY 5-36 TaxID=1678027 RepID=UPI00067081D1|nr:class I SAM-dependent methyltransferase [Kitasatospora sp. MY 5-36]
MRKEAPEERELPAYGEEVFAFAHPAQTDRLDALAGSCDPATTGDLARWDLPADARCLEIGAGAGTLALWLARRHPEGEVTATDTDLRFLTGLRHPALRVLRHDVRTDGFPPGTFDLVVARSVLCHLPERAALPGRMASWLKPGGRLYIEDPSFFPAASSPDPVVRRLGTAVTTTLATTLGSDVSAWARSFPAPLRGLGLVEVGMRVHCPTLTATNAAGRAWALSIADLLPAMARTGILAEADGAEALTHLRRPGFVDTAHAMVAMWGVRPPAQRPDRTTHRPKQTAQQPDQEPA